MPGAANAAIGVPLARPIAPVILPTAQEVPAADDGPVVAVAPVAAAPEPGSAVTVANSKRKQQQSKRYKKLSEFKSKDNPKSACTDKSCETKRTKRLTVASAPKRRPSNAEPLEQRLVKGGNNEGNKCQRGGKRGAARRAGGATRARAPGNPIYLGAARPLLSRGRPTPEQGRAVTVTGADVVGPQAGATAGRMCRTSHGCQLGQEVVPAMVSCRSSTRAREGGALTGN